MFLKCIFIIILVPVLAFAFEDTDQLAVIRRDLEAVKQSQKDIQKSLSAIRDVLSGKQPPLDEVYVTIAGSPSLGDAKARVIIVEFTDFQCPFCGAYA